MKIKLKATANCTIAIDMPQGASTQLRISITIIPKKKKGKAPVPEHLLQRINGCKSLPELLQLLFSTTGKTEAILNAFDARIDDLEKEGQTLPIHPLKQNNNGSITPTAAA